jgi:hypothetical protein
MWLMSADGASVRPASTAAMRRSSPHSFAAVSQLADALGDLEHAIGGGDQEQKQKGKNRVENVRLPPL